MERTKRLLLGSLSLVAISLMLCAPSAFARRHHAPRPRVSWTPAPAVNEGAPIPFSWRGSHLGRKHRLVVQRPVGTAHTWQTILRLSSNSGSGELPGFPLGTYRLRIADLVGRRVLAQQVAGIAVFGEVPFSTLFGSNNSGVHITPTTSFPYVNYYYGSSHLFTVEHNRCSHVHIAFVGHHGEYEDPKAPLTLTLVQESREPTTASAPPEAIGSLDAELVPGQSWGVNIAATPGVYINGYAVCDSAESFFP
jgi:hypothetical protein